jgi:hypothetical protein
MSIRAAALNSHNEHSKDPRRRFQRDQAPLFESGEPQRPFFGAGLAYGTSLKVIT